MIKYYKILLLGIIILLSIIFFWRKFMPKITVLPKKALIDIPVKISISNITANEQITVKASCKDKNKDTWTSQATFQANDKGSVNIAKQSPLAGTYNGIHPMGLLWSMAPIDKKIQHFSFDKNTLEIHLSVYSKDKLIVETIFYRLFISPDTEKIKIREQGIIGTLFYPKNMKNVPGVIVLPGSSGGIPENKAQLLAAHGYAVLALGYFGIDDLPKDLSNIPLEYFQKALHWLKKKSNVNDKKIALLGSSRGGELVLLLASTFPEEINAVVSCVPSNLVYSGFPQASKPAWTYKNSPITFMPSPSLEDISNTVKEGTVAFHKGTFEDPWHITPHFLYGMKKFSKHIDSATIPVENINCPLLIISGEDDKLWPSTLYGNLIMERLDEKKSSIKRKHLHFPGAGHAILFPYPPHTPVIGQPIYLPENDLWSQYGGNTKDNAYANKHAWQETLDFLNETLK